MKKMMTIFAFCLCCMATELLAQCTDCGKLVITQAIDGRTSDRKGLQVCFIDNVPDMSIYGITVDDGTMSDTEFIDSDFRFPAGSATAGDCFWLAYEAGSFETYMGLSAGSVAYDRLSEGDQGAGVINLMNGERNVYILCNGNVDDIFGYYLSEINDDGSDPAYWEDGWIVSNNDRCPNAGAMDLANWNVSGPNVTDSKDFANETGFPVGTTFSHASGANCANTKACGGFDICDFIQYACVEDDNGLDDFTATIIFNGSEAGLTITTLEDYDGELIVNSFANGVLELFIDGSIGSPWGIVIEGAGCDGNGIQIWDRIPDNCDDIVAPTEPTCTDGIQNGDETGVDCGGTTCSACSTEEPTCTDGVQNGDETGVDCGGATCPECGVAATCTDGVQNGDETGVDCGGATCPTCEVEPPVNEDVPTMGEWGLIILALLMLNSTMLFSMAGKKEIANGGYMSFNWKNSNSYPFNKVVFMNAALLTGVLLAFTSIYALTFYGFFTVTDVIGSAIAAPIFAYLLHLIVLSNKK